MTTTEEPPSSKGEPTVFARSVRRYVIALTVVVVLVGAYAAAGFLAVPHLIRSNLRSFVHTHYGREVSVGDIRFNPFTLKLDIENCALPDNDGEALIRFGKLHVELQLASLWRLAPSFHEIVLDRPYVRAVIRPDGALNLADLGKGLANNEPQPPRKSGPLGLYIDRLAVIDGSGLFEDRTHASPFRAELIPVDFELRDFSTTPKTGNRYTLHAASPDGARLDWNGTLRLEPVVSQGAFEVSGLPASEIWRYLQQPLPLQIPSGVIGFKGDYELAFAPGGPTVKLNVRDTTVADLKLRARQAATDYVELKRLDVGDTRLDLARRSIDVGKVSLTGGAVSAWLGPDGRLNLLDYLSSSTATSGDAASAKTANATAPAGATTSAASRPSEPAASASKPAAPQAAGSAAASSDWTITVPDIEVGQLKVTVEDRQVTPAVALELSPFDVHVKGYNTAPGTRLDLEVHTGINGQGKLALNGQLTPSPVDLQAHVDLSQFDLAVLQPYVAERTAMTLQSGLLGGKFDLQYGAAGNIGFKGDVQVNNLRTIDNELKRAFVRWKELRLAGIKYNSRPASLSIANITARDPYARVIIAPNRAINVVEVLAGPGGKSAAAKAGKSGESADESARKVSDNPSQKPDVGAAMDSALALRAGNATGNKPQSAADADFAAEKALTEKASGNKAGTEQANSNAPAGDQLAGANAAGEKASGKKSAGDRKSSRRGQKGRVDTATDGAAAAAAATPLPMSIGTVKIINGSANYADFWIQPNFVVGIQGLNGTVEGLSSDPDSRAKVQLDGQVDRYAPVQIDGQINLLSATAYTDLKMSFKGLELTTMTPYSGHFAGYKIDKGKLSVELGYKIDHRKLDAQQHFVIEQLQLGEKVDSPDAVKLPLRIAVALLKDRNGVIDIGLPMSGSLDDPKFRLGPLIWKAFVNVIVKAATAPFALLGHLFGGGEEMNFIDFPAGSAQLDEAGNKKLTALVKAMSERPGLKLDVPMVYSAQLDRPALALRRLNRQLLGQEGGKSGGKKQAGAAGSAAPGATGAGTATTGPSGAVASTSGTPAAAGQAPEPAPDPRLTNPTEHFRLLLAQYRKVLGKDAPVPPTAQAVLDAQHKKQEPQFEPAIQDLQSALVEHVDVPDTDLQELGKKRTESIQDVLITQGKVDPSRVFVINGTAKSDSGDKVRVEMSIK